MFDLWVFLGIFAFVFIFMIIRQNLQLGKMQLERLDQDVQIPSEIEKWTREHNFYFEGYYTATAGSTRYEIYAWQYSERPVFHCRYVTGEGFGKGAAIYIQSMDFVSYFEDDFVLTTSNRKGCSGAYMPRTFKQSFSGLRMEEFWEKHCESEEFLQRHGAKPLFAGIDFKESVEKYVHREMKYHRRSILWPLMILYWSFLGKYFWHNKSIREQYEQHMIKLPQEQLLTRTESWRDTEG